MKIGVGASKALSLLIVWCMVCSAFAGMLILMVPGAGQALEPSNVDGDKYIGEEFTESTLIINGGTYNLDGNLIIRSGGVVNITNGGVLNMMSSAGDFNGVSFSRVHHIIVEDGGQLNIIDSYVRTEPKLYNVTPALGVLVRNGGSLYAENSQLTFSGHILIDQASFVAYGSVVNGALITAMSSTVELYGSDIDGIPGMPLIDEEAFSYPFATAVANDLNVEYSFQRNPDTARTIVPAGTADDLTMDDANNVTVASGTGMTISGFDIGGLFFDDNEAISITLNALYKTADYFVATGDTFEYAEYLGSSVPATNMGVVKTYEDFAPEDTNQFKVLTEALPLDLSAMDLSVLTVTFNNTAGQNVLIDRVWIEVVLSIPAYHNMTMAGNTEFTAVDTYIGVNYDNYTSESTYRKLVVRDGSTANLYGVSVNGTFDVDGMGPFLTVGNTVQLKPLEVGTIDDTGEANVFNLFYNDGGVYYYRIDNGQTMCITQFNIGGVKAPISRIIVNAEYGAAAGYGSVQFLQWNITGTELTNMDMYIDLATITPNADSTTIMNPNLVNLVQLSNMNIVFNNLDPSQVSFDWIAIEAILNPSINIYRWADIHVIDTNGLPVRGAEVVARSDGGSPAMYYYNYSANLLPPAGVLAYLGVNITTYNITNELGNVAMPLLTDVIDVLSNSNSHPIPMYTVIATYEDLAGMNTTSNGTKFTAYPDLTPRFAMDLVLVDLELALPDLAVTDITTTPALIYEHDPASVQINVTNLGLNAAGGFMVRITDSIVNVTNYLGNITVPSLAAGATTMITVPWLSNFTVSGNHVITVTVDANDAIMEVSEENRFFESVVVLPLLADLAVGGASITFSDNPGLARETMTINVAVSNVGRIAANNANVTYYLGDPLGGGVPIGQSTISVPNGVTAFTSLDWVPIQIGSYPIYVVVNPSHAIAEYTYSNNMAFSTLRVDIQANETAGDWLINGTESWSVLNGYEYQRNIIIEDNGYLSFTDSQLYMRQASDTKPTQIVVRDNGTLVLDGTTVSSNFVLRIYLFNASQLFMNDATLSLNVILIIDGTSVVHIEESRVLGDLQAPATSSSSLVAINTTFGQRWSYFGGSSTAELTGCSINQAPPLSIKDSAVVTLYRWIEVSVYDGTGIHKIPGAEVTARSMFTSTVYNGMTGENGAWLFSALSDVVKASSRGVNLGYYQISAVYSHGGDDYLSVPIGTTQVSFNPDVALVRSDTLVRLDITGALPDIDPPFEVSNSTPFRGDEVTLSTIIYNTGVVTAFDVLVRFQDNSTGGLKLIKDVVISELAADSNVIVTVTWTAAYPLGNHTLSVTVDPLDKIPELNEDNNYNSTVVNVTGVPDLVVTNADIIIDSTLLVRGKTSPISVNVRNNGDSAISAFNVSFYDDGALINKSKISNLPSGQTGVASISWTPSTPGSHIVTVKVDEENVIIESNEADNQASKAVVVRDYPDLLASAVRFSVNGLAVSSVYVNTEVTITVDIYNIGQSTADPFYVVFWLNEEEIIGIVQASAIGAGNLASVSTTWIAEIVPDMGLYQDNNISVNINPESNATIAHINEMDDPTNANNWADQVLEVVDNRPDMAASNGRVIASSATIGQKVFVLFDLDNVGIIDGTGIIVTVSLVNETIDMPIFTQTVNVGAGNSLPYNVSYVVNVTSGNYTFVVDVDTGSDADQSNNVLEIDFVVVVPNPRINIVLGNNYDYAPGTSIFVQGTITQSGSNAPLAGQTIEVVIKDSQGFVLATAPSTTTNANGQFTSWVLVPSGKEGTQRLVVTVDTIEGEFSDDVNINIIAPFAPETIPSWVYLLIVAIVIAVIVIFSLYLYRVGLGRMVECGNCGALIPEASRHCPKCGVEFEADTAKCSECGAWIPSKAESCPDCGAKFMTEPIEAGQAPGYIEAMRKQYEEYIDAFRGQAKAALGSKYSEEKFMEWLKTEPNYLPFEEWLRKEEMSRRSGVFPCPACGTLNPRDSKICNRCGTVFEQQGRSDVPKAEEKKSPFRRIVRRSSEPKETPKEPEAPKEETQEGGDKPQ